MHRKSAIFLGLSVLAFGQQYTVPTPPKGTQPNAIPRIGMGTSRILRANTSEVVAKAIENGFRHFDCAYIYGNQKEVGIGIKEGLKRTGLSRQDLWITSKLWNDRHTRAEFAIEESLDQLQLDYLDLWLVHWPHDSASYNFSFNVVETWKGMQKTVRPVKGTRFIGVSNFGPQQIDDLMKLDGIKPQFHEFELHPYLQQSNWVEENFKRNITVIGYAPLGNTQNQANQGVSVDRSAVPAILKTDVVTSIAKARSCTPAQVVLAWNLHRKVVVIPKASQVEHQKENIATLDQCKITDEDAAKIKAIAEQIRFYPNACDYGLTEGCAMARAHPAKAAPAGSRP